MNVFYITSFNESLYKATGVHLLESFIGKQIKGNMICTYEGDVHQFPHKRVFYHNLEEMPDLAKFKEDNKDVIPVELGGEAKPCSCNTNRNVSSKFGRHEQFCPYSGWNYRSSNWFKKLVSMNYVITNYKFDNDDMLVWVDCDCNFMNQIEPVKMNEMFEGRDVFYMFGNGRRHTIGAIETGVLGFKIRGFEAIRNVYNRYVDGSYREEPRWDDSWMFTKEINRETPYTSLDIVRNNITVGDVLGTTKLGTFINHKKGFHHKNKIVKKFE